jgi:hypothetical protein
VKIFFGRMRRIAAKARQAHRQTAEAVGHLAARPPDPPCRARDPEAKTGPDPDSAGGRGK